MYIMVIIACNPWYEIGTLGRFHELRAWIGNNNVGFHRRKCDNQEGHRIYIHEAQRDHWFLQYFLVLGEYSMHQCNFSSGILYVTMHTPHKSRGLCLGRRGYID